MIYYISHINEGDDDAHLPAKVGSTAWHIAKKGGDTATEQTGHTLLGKNTTGAVNRSLELRRVGSALALDCKKEIEKR